MNAMTKGYAAVASALLFGTSPADAQVLSAMRFDLGSDYAVEATYDAEQLSVTVSLRWADQLALAVTLGNANVAHEGTKLVRLCKGCERVLFIPAYDLSSTYGATTGILAWSSGDSWSLSILPMVRPNVVDEDRDGIFELVDSLPTKPEPTIRRFQFSEGFVTPVD